MENAEHSIETEFRVQLLQIYNASKKTVLFTKDEYFSLMKELKEAEKAGAKTNRQVLYVKEVCNSSMRRYREAY